MMTVYIFGLLLIRSLLPPTYFKKTTMTGEQTNLRGSTIREEVWSWFWVPWKDEKIGLWHRGALRPVQLVNRCKDNHSSRYRIMQIRCQVLWEVRKESGFQTGSL
jgi:hypothetical protein